MAQWSNTYRLVHGGGQKAFTKRFAHYCKLWDFDSERNSITTRPQCLSKPVDNWAGNLYTGGSETNTDIWDSDGHVTTRLCKCWKYITSSWETIRVWIGPYTGFSYSWTDWLMQNTSIPALCMSLFVSDLSSSPLGFRKTESGALACCWGKGEPSGLQQMLFTPSTAASHIDSMQKFTEVIIYGAETRPCCTCIDSEVVKYCV